MKLKSDHPRMIALFHFQEQSGIFFLLLMKGYPPIFLSLFLLTPDDLNEIINMTFISCLKQLTGHRDGHEIIKGLQKNKKNVRTFVFL